MTAALNPNSLPGSARSSLLVIRHEPCTSLGLLETAAQTCARSIHYWEIAAGAPFSETELDRFSHVIILGGTMSAYEEAQYPFLRDEFRIVEAAIDRGIPMLGICLGAQVLARVLGAQVYRGNAGREVGWCEVQMTPAAAKDRLLRPALDGEGTAFYEFEEISDEKAFKATYRQALDELPVDDATADRIVAEANDAFGMNMKMFNELEGNLVKAIGQMLFNSLTRRRTRGATELATAD